MSPTTNIGRERKEMSSHQVGEFVHNYVLAGKGFKAFFFLLYRQVMQGLKATKEIQEKRQSFRAPKGREVKLAEMVWMALMEPTVNPDPLDSLETLDGQGT